MAGLEGTRLGDYELIERIGSGGMAEVYRARQLTAFGREVALKVVRVDFSANEEFRARFLREAQAISRLSHPNILPLIEFGDENGTLYLVTPLAREGTLRDLLKQRGGTLPLAEAAAFFIQLCNAVHYAHEEGIIHRDIKPQNVLLQQRSYVLLADFGIARDRNVATITNKASSLGTIDYMAPEQAVGQADTRSDIYSLGVVLYQMLTGHLPYEGNTPLQVLAMTSSEPLPDPRAYTPGLPEALVEVLQTATAKNPDERFQSASALGNAVQQVIDSSTARSRIGIPGAWASARTQQEGKPPGISVPLPTVDLTTPEQTRRDPLETRPGSDVPLRAVGQDGRPPGISVPLTDVRPGASAPPAPSATAPTSGQPTEKVGAAPLTAVGTPPAQPTYRYPAPPGYDGPGSSGPPSAYGPGAPQPTPRKRPFALLLVLSLLAVVVVAGGIGVLLTKLSPATTTAGSNHTPLPSPTPTIPAGFRLYTSPDHTFTIIYPAGWQQTPSPLGGNGIEFDGPASSNPTFTALNEGTQAESAGAFDDTVCREFTGTGTASSHTTITLKGRQWVREACDAILGIGHVVSEGVTYHGSLYIMLYNDTSGSFSSDDAQYFARMEQSFTFLT